MLIEAFPEATLYALNANPRAFWEEKLGRRVISPPLGGLFASRFLVSALYPLAAILMCLVRVKADVVIAYSSTCGKYVRLDCKKSILYSNYPNRGLYQPEKLISSKVVRTLIRPLIFFMKVIERRQILKYNSRISISEASRLALLDFAGLESEILMPPFDERAMSAPAPTSSSDHHDYFTLVSRLEPEKELEYVIDAFKTSRHRLRVIGRGSLLAEMRRGSPPNVEFLGYVDDATLARELASARALIFPSDIEYSLVPLEAIFVGTPVVSYSAPAMREILTDIDSGNACPNALFYAAKTSASLQEALDRFNTVSWDREAVKERSKCFSRVAFIARIREVVYGPN
jgi:glycosyltransferase involved in cell wall biosynthesis